MIRAIIRPEKERHVIRTLESIGEYSMTKMPVTGRGRQGAQTAALNYAEIAKVMLMIVVPDERADAVIDAIIRSAFTGFPGDGRIFVTEVQKSVRLRTE